jgi:hypothetical protein
MRRKNRNARPIYTPKSADWNLKELEDNNEDIYKRLQEEKRRKILENAICIGKQVNRNSSQFRNVPNCSISSYRRKNVSNGSDYIQFIFRNLDFEKFPKRVYAMVVDNFIYFKDSDKGYLLTLNKTKDVGYCKSYSKEPQWSLLEKFKGDYEVKYDKIANWYYIERED